MLTLAHPARRSTAAPTPARRKFLCISISPSMVLPGWPLAWVRSQRVQRARHSLVVLDRQPPLLRRHASRQPCRPCRWPLSRAASCSRHRADSPPAQIGTLPEQLVRAQPERKQRLRRQVRGALPVWLPRPPRLRTPRHAPGVPQESGLTLSAPTDPMRLPAIGPAWGATWEPRVVHGDVPPWPKRYGGRTKAPAAPGKLALLDAFRREVVCRGPGKVGRESARRALPTQLGALARRRPVLGTR
jgi:hypothetical protein